MVFGTNPPQGPWFPNPGGGPGPIVDVINQGPSNASEHLALFVSPAAQVAPSITIGTMQRTDMPPGSRGRKGWPPAVASFGWGINGVTVDAGSGVRDSLLFEDVKIWRSDRQTNPNDIPPDWQQFAAEQADHQRITLSPEGSSVRAAIVLPSPGNRTITSLSLAYDLSSQLLLFNFLGMGVSSYSSLVLIALHSTGGFGWL
jgi:hypothetical protein